MEAILLVIVLAFKSLDCQSYCICFLSTNEPWIHSVTHLHIHLYVCMYICHQTVNSIIRSSIHCFIQSYNDCEADGIVGYALATILKKYRMKDKIYRKSRRLSVCFWLKIFFFFQEIQNCVEKFQSPSFPTFSPPLSCLYFYSFETQIEKRKEIQEIESKIFGSMKRRQQ